MLLIQNARDARDQIFHLIADLKWVIAISALMSVLLWLPDQVRELYRVSVLDASVTVEAKFLIPLALIAIVIWLGALQVTEDSLSAIATLQPATRWLARALPPLLGVAPVVFCAIALVLSVPAVDSTAEVGNPLRKFYQELARSVGTRLIVHALLFFVVSAISLYFALKSHHRLIPLTAHINV